LHPARHRPRATWRRPAATPSRYVAVPLWALAEFAICATDLAEVIGTAIGLNLLFGIPLEIGVLYRARRVLSCRCSSSASVMSRPSW
jgi:NRAMP (natural resistance-associated macrophage protein)-like metal ion transporter